MPDKALKPKIDVLTVMLLAIAVLAVATSLNAAVGAGEAIHDAFCPTHGVFSR